MSDWEAWVTKVTGGATARQVAERIGKSHTTALRWMHNGTSPEQVIAFAIAYNADIIQALVAAGWISESDLENLNLASALRSLTEVELAGELYRRALAQQRSGPDPFAGDRPKNP